MIQRRGSGFPFALKSFWGGDAAVLALPTVSLEHDHAVERFIHASELLRAALVGVAGTETVLFFGLARL